MNFGTVSDIVVAIVALFGLGISIYNFYIKRQEKKPHLNTKINYGFLSDDFGTSETMLMLDVGNIGEKQVLVSSIEILLDHGKKLMYPSMEGDRNLPFELQPGQGAHFWIPVDVLKSSLKKRGYKRKLKIRANFKDALGNNYSSTKKSLDL